MKLIRKFVVGAIAMLVVVLVAAYIGKQTLHNIRASYDKVEVQILPAIHVLEDVRFYGLRLASLLSEVSLVMIEDKKAYMDSDLEHEYVLMGNAAKHLRQALQHYEALLMPEEQADNIMRIHQYANTLLQNTEALMALETAKERVKFVVSITNQTQRAEKDFLQEVSKALQVQQGAFVKHKIELERNMDSAKKDLTWLAVFGFFVLILALAYLHRVFLIPVLALTGMAQRVGRGDLSGRLHVHSDDELGRLTSSFNAMVANLKNSMVSKAYFEQVLRYLPGALIVLNRSGHIERINRGCEKLLGYKSDELLGKPFRTLMSSDKRAYYEPKGLGNLGDVSHAEGSFYHKQGHLVDVSFSARPIWGEDKKIIGAVYIAHDVSDVKDMQAELERSQRLDSLGVLAGGVAHDFNNTLSIMMGNALLLEGKLDQLNIENKDIVQMLKSPLTAIHEAGDKAADLCKQMLAYSGQGRYASNEVELTALLRMMTGLLKSACAKRNSIVF